MSTSNKKKRPAAYVSRTSLNSFKLVRGSGFSFHVDDLLTVIVTAVLADTVSELHLLAARALDDTGRGQLPIRTAHAAARLRDFSLRTSHCLHLLILIQQRC